MRLLTRKRESGEIELGIIYGTIVLIGVGAARFLPLEKLAPRCLFRAFTGVSCPTCGATRSLVHFSHGDLVGAFVLNPLMTILLASAIAYFVVSCIGVLLNLPRVVLCLSPVEKNVMRVSAVLLFIVNWSYVVSSL